tara:strand:- start:1915 stop:2211 length:297 start_codon:yes stop_codon:yes gene_type:complete
MRTTLTSDSEFYITMQDWIKYAKTIDAATDHDVESTKDQYIYVYLTIMSGYLESVGNTVQKEDVVINPCVGIPARRFYDQHGTEFNHAGTAPWSKLQY